MFEKSKHQIFVSDFDAVTIYYFLNIFCTLGEQKKYEQGDTILFILMLLFP